jgi:hypothetical protein
MNSECQSSITDVNTAFTDEPIVTHCEQAETSILPTEASGFTIASILTEYEDFGICIPVDFIIERC